MIIGHIQSGNLRDAELLCQKIIMKKPHNFSALYFLGVIAYKSLDIEQAMRYFKKARDVNPTNAAVHYNLGLVLHESKQTNEAVECYKQALRFDPALSDAYYNLGTAFQELGRFEEAFSCYQSVVQKNPGYVEAYYNMGTVLKEQGRHDEAIAIYDHALAIRPDYIAVRWAKCMSRLPVIYSCEEDVRTSREHYTNELTKLRDSMLLVSSQHIDSASKAVGSQQPFLLACQGLNDRQLQNIYGQMVCDIMAKRYPHFANRPALPAPFPGEPVRVGIVSGYFCYHSVWKIPIRGWIENLDKTGFNLYGYSTSFKKDSVTEYLKQYFVKFVEGLNNPFEELCKNIRNDNLHILLYPEIGMDPNTLRMAALRLAPVQCVSLGHPDTTGLPTIDYYLSSDLMEPADAEEHYTEKLIRLPNLSFHYTAVDIPPSTTVNRETLGLRSDSVLYLCSHALFTHLPQYDEIYAHIASEVDAQFLFIAHPVSRITELFYERLKHYFALHKLDWEKHIVILRRLDAAEYQALTRMSDVFLDTPGWSANNSTLEAVTYDLPVVTLPGGLMRQRHCFGILKMIDMTETIASSVDEYVSLAVKLGKDREFRRSVSEKIASNKNLIYRDHDCITALEDFIKKVVREKL